MSKFSQITRSGTQLIVWNGKTLFKLNYNMQKAIL